MLEGITGAAGLLDVTGVAVSRHYSTKAANHEVVRAKLNTVHGHISKAVEDCHVSDEEYKLILDKGRNPTQTHTYGWRHDRRVDKKRAD